MALKVIVAPLVGYKYIPQSQKGEENPFTLWVKPLTAKQLMNLEDKVVKRSPESEVTLSAGEFSFNVCKLAIVSWENIEDEQGQALKLKLNSDGTVSDESICYIPPELITEIANVVSAVSRDKGNIQIFFGEDEPTDEAKPVKEKKVKSSDAVEATEAV